VASACASELFVFASSSFFCFPVKFLSDRSVKVITSVSVFGVFLRLFFWDDRVCPCLHLVSFFLFRLCSMGATVSVRSNPLWVSHSHRKGGGDLSYSYGEAVPSLVAISWRGRAGINLICRLAACLSSRCRVVLFFLTCAVDCRAFA